MIRGRSRKDEEKEREVERGTSESSSGEEGGESEKPELDECEGERIP